MREAVEVLGVQTDPREQLARARSRNRALGTPASRSGVARICPTRLRGFSDACGSWKTICISRRTGASSRREAFVMSRPRKRDPARRSRRRAAPARGSASSCRSPTRRRRRASRPRPGADETSSTAWTCSRARPSRPRRTGKCTWRCSTSSRGRPGAAMPVSGPETAPETAPEPSQRLGRSPRRSRDHRLAGGQPDAPVDGRGAPASAPARASSGRGARAPRAGAPRAPAPRRSARTRAGSAGGSDSPRAGSAATAARPGSPAGARERSRSMRAIEPSRPHV